MENKVNFPKSPQQYFAYLDILSQFGAPSLYSRIKGNKASLKVNNNNVISHLLFFFPFTPLLDFICIRLYRKLKITPEQQGHFVRCVRGFVSMCERSLSSCSCPLNLEFVFIVGELVYE